MSPSAAVAIMSASRGCRHHQRHGCEGMSRLIAEGGAACAQALLEAGGVGVIVAALRAFPSDAGLSQAGCCALSGISQGGDACAQAVVAAGGAVEVVAALRAHPTDLGVQREGCRALQRIAASGNAACCAQAVAEAGGAVAAVASLLAHPSDAGEIDTYRSGDTQLLVCDYRLSVTVSSVRAGVPHNPARCTEYGDPVDPRTRPMVTDCCFSAPPPISIPAGVQKNGCAALGRIAASSSMGARAVVEAGGAVWVVKALQAHPTDLGVHLAGCAALSFMVAAGCAQEVAEAGGPVAMVTMMRASADLHVQRTGCIALGHVAEGGAACALAVAEAGGAVAIVAMLRAHLNLVDVQRNGCAALGLIAQGGVTCAQAVAIAGGEIVAVAAAAAHPACEGIRACANVLQALNAKARLAADAAMAALLLEDAAEKEADSRKQQGKSKKVDLKKQSSPLTSPPTSVMNASAARPEEPTIEARVAADDALRCAMTTGEYDALVRALEAHRGVASEAALQQGRTERDRLAKKRKKEGQRLRKANVGAMIALPNPRLQALDEAGGAERAAVEQAATERAAAKRAVTERAAVSRAALEGAAVEQAAAAAKRAAVAEKKRAAAKHQLVKQELVERAAVQRAAVERAAVEREAVEQAEVERGAAKRAATEREGREMVERRAELERVVTVDKERAAAERATAELAAAEQAVEEQNVAAAIARSMASLQVDEEQRRRAVGSGLVACGTERLAVAGGGDGPGGGGSGGRRGACTSTHVVAAAAAAEATSGEMAEDCPLAQLGSTGHGQERSIGEPAICEALQSVRICEVSASAPAASQLWFASGSTEPLAASAQPVLTLADVGDITGHNNVPESTLGGETTCIVCFVHPKTHLAAPCGHQCVCGPCAEQMQHCPYCRAPVQLWVQARIV